MGTDSSSQGLKPLAQLQAGLALAQQGSLWHILEHRNHPVALISSPKRFPSSMAPGKGGKIRGKEAGKGHGVFSLCKPVAVAHLSPLSLPPSPQANKQKTCLPNSACHEDIHNPWPDPHSVPQGGVCAHQKEGHPGHFKCLSGDTQLEQLVMWAELNRSSMTAPARGIMTNCSVIEVHRPRGASRMQDTGCEMWDAGWDYGMQGLGCRTQAAG